MKHYPSIQRKLFLLPLNLLFCLWAYGQHDQHQQAEAAMDSVRHFYPGGGREVPSTGNTETYRLTVSDTTVNYAGKKMPALATNGQIPAPTLRFVEGDTAALYVENRTDKTVSFHWHGILLPNRFDGVPMLTTEVIEPGDTYLFKFKIKQHGTYWYHSHTELDEQVGQYGPIVIHPQQGMATKEKVIHLSDWINERPWEVHRTLKRHSDWYTIERQAVQSYARAIARGHLGTKLWFEWKRMPDFDLADVNYDVFLANGQESEDASAFELGDRVRLRVINGGASSLFWLEFAGGSMTVVAADGLEVEPVEVDKVFIATAETYDLMITIPEDGKYEFRATSWDLTGHTSVWFGEGTEVPAPDLPKPDYFKLAQEMQDMSGMMDMSMGAAPKDIPEIKIYPPGEVPTPSAGMEMGMNMNNGSQNDQEMDHQGKKKLDGQENQMEGHQGHQMEMKEPAPEDSLEIGHQGQEMEMAHGMLDSTITEGNIYKASEMTHQRMTMDGMNGMSKNPLGTTMTGYKQVQAAFLEDTLLNYDMLRAKVPTILAEDRPTREVHLYLTGNMRRYVWSINDLPLSKADKILVNKGENVRFVMHNTTMMSHPMHLHGHFFRVVNKQGDYSPLKHTLNIAPMEMVTIEFAATEEKDWFFHCHLLYHMMSGMARTVSYDNPQEASQENQETYKKFVSDDRAFFPFAELQLQSNGVFGELNLHNTYWLLNAEGKADWHGNYEVAPKLQRFFGPRQYFAAYVGGEFSSEEMEIPGVADYREEDQIATLGIRYFLPMSLWADLRIDHRGDFRLELERHEIPLTQRWRLGGSVEFDFVDSWEYTVKTFYIMTKYLAVSANYDSEYGFGGGLMLVY